MSQHFKRRDLVEFNGRRGHVVGVVASSRRITRGRRAGTMEYNVAPLKQKGKRVFYTVPGRMLQPSNKTATEAEIDAALGEQADISKQRRENQHEREETNREALQKLDIREGDTVLIRGRDCADWRARILKVNYANGRVGIEAPNRRGIRWIDSRSVKEVITEERPSPVKLSERVLDDLQAQGWAQVRYGREFIERSYVVAFTKELARRGDNYEVASDTVYFDPEWKLYWRATGSFD